MANHSIRQKSTLSRLKAKLQKNRESLADQFDFRMFVIINFKNPAKKSAVFEIEQVHPVMTNDYEAAIQQGVSKNEFSEESCLNLLNQDIVQLHARKWCSRRSDIIACSQDVDFLVWPRNDIESVQCKVFSRWKHETKSCFRPIQNEFTLHSHHYMNQIDHYRVSNEPSGIVLTNPEETMFLFLSRHTLDPSRGQNVIFRLNSLCIYVPQVELTRWGTSNLDRIMTPYLQNI